jgi:toxin ParE1/3/4
VTERHWNVDFALTAQDDLDDIAAWYESQLVPETGLRLVASIIDRVDQLERFPESGKVVPEFDNPLLRELELPPFRIIYRMDDSDTVHIVRVWRSERLMDLDLGGNTEQALPADAHEPMAGLHGVDAQLKRKHVR